MATGSENSPTVQFSLLTDLREVFGAVKGGAIGCIDIPIGLAENGARPADLAAARALIEAPAAYQAALRPLLP